jgi:hypothetical protein
MWWTKWKYKYKSKVSTMSGSPRPKGSFNEELLFADDIFSPVPPRPQQLARPVAKQFSSVAPSDRKIAIVPGKRTRAEHVAIQVNPVVPTTFVPRPRELAPPPIPAFYDPTGRKLLTSPSAFRINPDSVVKAPLRRTKKAGRGRRKGKFTRHKARAYRSRKASRPSTRASLRR